MNTKRWLLASLAAFVVVFVLDGLVHGWLLRGLYEQTASVWRPQHVAGQLMWLMTLGQALFALAFAWFYTKGHESKKPGLGQGLRFGWCAGLLLVGAHNFVWYVVLPVPFVLNVGWLASALADCLAAGAAVGLIYRKP